MLHPVPIGIGPIEWNYRCSGKRDSLNNLQRVSARILTHRFTIHNTNPVFDKWVSSWLETLEEKCDGRYFEPRVVRKSGIKSIDGFKWCGALFLRNYMRHSKHYVCRLLFWVRGKIFSMTICKVSRFQRLIKVTRTEVLLLHSWLQEKVEKKLRKTWDLKGID